MSAITSYQKALDYIYSFIDFSLTKNLRYSPEKFNLSRMNLFLTLLGNPQSDYKIIHVAGTKGKGSICAMLTSILTCAGYKTGFYSSPHMIDFSERIRIDNQLIAHHDIVKYINNLKSTIDEVDGITTFEISTALAFKYFSDQKVDFGVIEVGMGGRFDATNVVNPVVSAISTISHDHTQVLGNTLAKIAYEKAGIIKPHIPVVISHQKKSALLPILKIAEERNSRVIDANKLLKANLVAKDLKGQEFEIMDEKKIITKFHLPLLGKHQVSNALVTYAVIRELRHQENVISKESIKNGFASVNWPGRFEIIQKKPLIVIDGAHNPDSFRKLKAAINDYLPLKKVIMIFGVSEDKNVRSMLRIVKPVVENLIITRSNHPRALEIEKIKIIADKLGFKNQIEDKIEDAILIALSKARNDTAIIASGSIFIAGAVSEFLNKKRKIN